MGAIIFHGSDHCEMVRFAKGLRPKLMRGMKGLGVFSVEFSFLFLFLKAFKLFLKYSQIFGKIICQTCMHDLRFRFDSTLLILGHDLPT